MYSLSELVSMAERGSGGGRRPEELERELLVHAPTRGNARAYVREATSSVIDACSLSLSSSDCQIFCRPINPTEPNPPALVVAGNRWIGTRPSTPFVPSD
jgi:hypothetical protein